MHAINLKHIFFDKFGNFDKMLTTLAILTDFRKFRQILSKFDKFWQSLINLGI